MRSIYCLIVVVVVSRATGRVLGQHADALFAVGPNGQMVSGRYSFDTNMVVDVDTRVYEGEFEGPFGGVYTVDEPGFNALAGGLGGLPAGYSTLPGSAAVGFAGRAFAIDGQASNLWHWNGAGGVSFAPVTAPTVLEVSKSPSASFSSVLDGSNSDVAGFVIETTGADGFLHKHIDFSVYNTDATPAAAGFYLWAMSFDAGASLETDLVYFVHGAGIEDEDAHEDAVSFVESVLVPEPAGVLVVMGLGVLGVGMRRRGGCRG